MAPDGPKMPLKAAPFRLAVLSYITTSLVYYYFYSIYYFNVFHLWVIFSSEVISIISTAVLS